MQINKRKRSGLRVQLKTRDWFFITAISTALIGVGSLIYARKSAAEQLELTKMDMVLPRLDPAFSGFRLAHISDIHMSSMNRERLDEIVDRVNALKADLIAITGDFVTHHHKNYSRDLSASLSRLRAPEGVYAVLGNHDHWAGVDEVRSLLEEAGIIELRNKVVRLIRQGKHLHIAGVDSTYVQADRLDDVLAELPEEGAAVLLAHEPDYADTSAATGRFDLQLSGHSHGGQAYLPIIGSPFLPPHARKYPRGLYEIDGMKLYTNRGLGTIHINARINSTPEIALLTLCPPDRGNGRVNDLP
jgi:predicted MPP superfamily phosphohydrolase